MPSTVTVGQRLKALREKAGLSQEQLARAAGVDRSTIGMYETGQRVPRDSIKIRLSELLGDTVENIFFTR